MHNSTVETTLGISNKDLDEVLFDLRIEGSGGRILIAVDPREAENFCFPHRFSDRTISEIADYQTAFFEVFYGHDRLPQILAEYGPEFEAMLAHFARQGSRAVELVEKLLETIPPSVVGDISAPPTLDSIGRHFHIVLAVVMGVYRIGLDRLNEIYGRLRREALPADIKGVLEAISQRYERGKLTEIMLAQALQFVSRQRRYTPSALEEIRSTIYDDVCAIDRILFLNRELEAAFLRGEISERIMFLYTSSTDKAEVIFNMPAVREHLAVVDGSQVSPYRSPMQLLCYALHKASSGDARTRATATAANLKSRQDAITEERHLRLVRKLSSSAAKECPVCILDGGVSDTARACPWRSVCEKVTSVREEVNVLRRNVQNLCLIARIKEYRELLDANSGQREPTAYVECFRQVFSQYADEQQRTKEALGRVKRLAKLIEAKKALGEFLGSAHAIASAAGDLHRGQDMITSREQHLPTQLSFTDGRRKKIFGDLVVVYTSPVPLRADRLELLEDAATAYLDLDAEVVDLDAEHELLRCCLYLGFSSCGGNERAAAHAEGMAEWSGDRLADFSYIRLWALRRSRNFGEAHDVGVGAIKQWPLDPRFYHGCALITLALWWEEKGLQPSLVKGQFEEARGWTERAIELYQQRDVVPNDLIAVCYKDLALFCSHSNGAGVYDLPGAQSAIEKLKEYAPMDWYADGYPEYLHAEAQVCLAEYMALDDGVAKLVKAIVQVEKALEIYEKATFKTLLREAQHQAAKRPFVHITLIQRFSDSPTIHDTAVIAGRASLGEYRGSTKIVLYALTDQWYVQPDDKSPFTEISPNRWENPAWQNQTHVGSQYAALLVTKDFKINSPLKNLPTGTNVLATDVKPGVF